MVNCLTHEGRIGGTGGWGVGHGVGGGGVNETKHLGVGRVQKFHIHDWLMEAFD